MDLWSPTGRADDVLEPYRSVDRTRGGASWLMANMVGGVDGSAAVGGRVGALSEGADSELFRLMRALADVVLVGAQTVRAEGYGPVRLPADHESARLAAGRSRRPVMAIVSRSLQLDWGSALFDPTPEGVIVITTGDAAPAALERARRVATVIVAGEDRVDLRDARTQLAGLGHRVLLCEGGPTLLGQLAAADQLDELCLTLSPTIGGDPLPISITPPGADLRRLRLCHVGSDGDTLFLRYERPEW